MGWMGKEVYVGRVFEREPIGLKQEEILKAYDGPVYLGIVEENRVEYKKTDRIKILN